MTFKLRAAQRLKAASEVDLNALKFLKGPDAQFRASNEESVASFKAEPGDPSIVLDHESVQKLLQFFQKHKEAKLEFVAMNKGFILMESL